MKLFLRCFIFILFLLATVTTMNGCWNYRELNQLAIVSGVGIDSGNKSGDVKLSVQIIKPSEVKTGGMSGGGGGGGESKPPFVVKTKTGHTVLDAIKNFNFNTDRQLYWPDNQIIIFGRKLAESGVAMPLDFFVRNNEPRPTVWIAVATGNAGDVLNVPGDLEKVSAMEIAQLISIQNLSSMNVRVNLQDFLSRLLSKTTAPIAAIIKIDQTKKQINLSGTAVFKGDRMVGELNKYQTRGLLWIQGKAKHTGMIINVPGGKAGFEIIRSRTKVKPVLSKNKPSIKINIWDEAYLDCQMSPEELTKPDQLKSLARRKATAIRNEVMSVIKKTQELNADIFGFGEQFRHSFPKEWKGMENHWDELFTQLQVKVDVKCNIRLIGLTVQPVFPPKE
jgi:spore germination protein KC